MTQRSALLEGLVVASHGRHCMVETPDGERRICHPRGKKNQAVVGDHVLWQAPPEASDDWFGGVVAEAAGRVRAEEFPAIVSGACRTCPVQQLCPARNPAQEVALC